MGVRFEGAKIASAISARALSSIAHRPAANLPGKIGLLLDPLLISELRPRLREGCVVVVGTNGKTTVTNQLADAFESSGKTVACNRTGANLDSGIASALLRAKSVDWGVLECDELWLARVLPQLKANFVVLLNLFRDQLDRMGEIEHIQDSIKGALAASPTTTLIYNCDDPLCQAIANNLPNKTVPFGVLDQMDLAQNRVADAGLCQQCDQPLEYAWHQYGHLGAYRCPSCEFSRATPAYAAHDVVLSRDGIELCVSGRPNGSVDLHAQSSQTGAYTVYNLTAVCAAGICCSLPPEHIAHAISSFAPDNGRLQRYDVNGCSVLLNLAKNPTGFNQNLRIIEGEPGPAAAAFFVNDKEADGHDVSWLWDVDFQELAERDTAVFAGGSRSHDVQVRLKYAGLEAPIVSGAKDFIERAIATAPDAKLYLIANYTALPSVKAELDSMVGTGRKKRSASDSEPAPKQRNRSTAERAHTPQSAFTQPERTDAVRENVPSANKARLSSHSPSSPSSSPSDSSPLSLSSEKLTIAHFYPELLNLYGDGGNVTILAHRARQRGIDVNVTRIGLGDELALADIDIAFLGGGPDRKQRIASQELLAHADELRAYVEDDGMLLAICGGYQILGRTWVLGDEEVAGLDIVDAVTKRTDGGSHNRLVSNIALSSPLATIPVIGYENHAGRTFLGPSAQPFGRVIGHSGKGNNDHDGTDGIIYRNVIGTYLHGPVLAKNPEIADHLIERALARRAHVEGRSAPSLPPLDDQEERAANAFMCAQLKIHRSGREQGTEECSRR